MAKKKVRGQKFGTKVLRGKFIEQPFQEKEVIVKAVQMPMYKAPRECRSDLK